MKILTKQLLEKESENAECIVVGTPAVGRLNQGSEFVSLVVGTRLFDLTRLYELLIFNEWINPTLYLVLV